MREVQIIQWCDMCGAKTTPATTAFAIAMNEGERLTVGARFLDVCDAHASELKTLGETVAEVGTRPKSEEQPETPRARRDDVNAECPVCGSVHVSRGALAIHLRRVHKTPISNFPGLRGQRGISATDRRTTLMPCPVCSEMFGGPQGVAAHARSKHPESQRDA